MLSQILEDHKILPLIHSDVNGFPVYGISFRFGRKNEIRKEYLGTGY